MEPRDSDPSSRPDAVWEPAPAQASGEATPGPGVIPPEELRLRLYPDPVLKQRARRIGVVDDRVRAAARRMFEIMYEEQGIGLAGPQVGWLGRIFVINLTSDPEEVDEERVFIDPVLRMSEGRESGEEGCLSLPEIRVDVDRAERLTVEATDLEGQRFEMDVADLLARCIQHENDHLDGILIVQRIPITARLGVRKALKELARQYRNSRRAG